MPPKIPVGKCTTCYAKEVKIRPNPFNPKKLQCEACREVEIIGITALKEKYQLKDADLEGFKMVKEPQPAFLKRPDKRWYLVSEVEKRAEIAEKEKAKVLKEKEKKAEEKKRAKEEKEEEKRIANEEKEKQKLKREKEKDAAAKKKADGTKGKRGVAMKVKAPKKEIVPGVADSDDKDFIVKDEEDFPSQDYESTPGASRKISTVGRSARPQGLGDDEESDVDIVPTPTPKKRGRPSKARTSEIEESEPKKRGRPSNASTQQKKVVLKSDTETEDSTPKLHGRPHLPSVATPYPKHLVPSSEDDEEK